jgi:hypothetical protein
MHFMIEDASMQSHVPAVGAADSAVTVATVQAARPPFSMQVAFACPTPACQQAAEGIGGVRTSQHSREIVEGHWHIQALD